MGQQEGRTEDAEHGGTATATREIKILGLPPCPKKPAQKNKFMKRINPLLHSLSKLPSSSVN